MVMQQISVGVTVIGFFVGVIGHKNKVAVSIGAILFFLGLLGIYFSS